MKERITKFLSEYFKLLELEVDFEIEETEVVSVNLMTNSDLSGLLIGTKGRNIYSLQRILNIVFNKEDNDKNIIVNIGDWRKKEEDRLKDLAIKTVDHVKQSGQPQNLYNLTPSQRRIIHTFLAEIEGVKTESQGEGSERYLVVSLK